MARRILSLDICDDAVSVVLVRTGIREARVEFTGRHRYRDAEDDVRDVFDAMLSDLTTRTTLSGVACRAAVPAAEISFRNITLPFVNAGKIRQVLPFELEPLLPYAVEDIQTGFSTVAPMSNPHHTAILAAAVSKARLSSIVDLFAAHKLPLEQVTISGYARVHGMAHTWRPDATWIFLDWHAASCTLYLCTAGHIALIRPVMIPPSATDPVDTVAGEVSRTLTAFADRYGMTGAPEVVVVGGPHPPDDASQGILSARTGLPVVRPPSVNGTPLIFDHSHEADTAREELDNAIALALADPAGPPAINFLTGGFSPLKKWAEHRGRLIRTGLLAALVLMIGICKMGYEVHVLRQQRMAQEQQMATIFKSVFPSVTRIEDPFKQMQVAVRELKKTPLSSERYAGQPRIIDILDQLGRHIPDRQRVHLSTVLINPGQLDITGTTDSFNAVDALKGKLSEAPLFKGVTIGSAKLAKDQNRVNFKIRVTL